MASPRPEVIDAIQHFEDASGDPNATSSKGAIGPMQIMPSTAKLYGIDPEALKDPKVNIPLGTKIFGDLLDRYNGNERAALIAYNQGTKSFDAGKIVPGTARYAENVLQRASLRVPPSGPVDQAYTARKQGEQDAADGRDLITSNPAAFQQFLASRGGDATAGMQPPKSPAEAGAQQQAVEGFSGSEAAKTTGDKAIDYAAALPGSAIETGLSAVGVAPEHAATAGNVVNAAMMGYGAVKGGIAIVKGIKGLLGAGEGAAKAGEAASGATTAVKDTLPSTEQIKPLAEMPGATPELKQAVNALQPAVRDPETGKIYTDPEAKNHGQVYDSLPPEVAAKDKLDTGFVGADGEYMTRQQTHDHLIAAQTGSESAAGTPPATAEGNGAAANVATTSAEPAAPVPATMYHGTSAENAASIQGSGFDTARFSTGTDKAGLAEAGLTPGESPGGALGKGFYFADSPKGAKAYAEGTANPAVISAQIDKSGVLDASGENRDKLIEGPVKQWLADKLKDQPPLASGRDPADQYIGLHGTTNVLREYAEANGYKGLTANKETVIWDKSAILSPSNAQHAAAAATPETAAQSLAQRQLDNLKAARVGESTAAEFGRPDIATQVPEALTMQESQSLRQNLESYYSQGSQPPKMAAHVQALASTYQEENEGIHALNLNLRARAANGEDVTPDLNQLVNRWSAMAENYSTLAGARSDVGRSLQVLDPNKPGNAFVAATARLAQEIGVEGNPQKLSDLLASIKPEQFPRVAGQMAEDVGKGRALYNAFNEYYVNNLLSNAGRTGARIGTSNAISALLTLPRAQIEAMLPGSPVKMGEPLARIQGMADGFWHALDVSFEALKTGGRTSQIEGGSVSPFVDSNKAISGQAFGLDGTGMGTAIDYLGNVLRLPARGITAVHQFGHSVATSMETHALAWRQAIDQAQTEGANGLGGYQRAQAIYKGLLNDPPADLRLNASKAADVTTFANQLEGMPADAQKLLQYPVLKQLMPFFKVAYNVKKMGADMTPGLNVLTNASDLTSGQPAQQSAAAAKIAFGSLMGVMISHEFHNGNIVLDKYGSPQFKIGDKLVSVPEPLAFPIATVGNYLQNRDAMSDPDAIDKAGAAARALGSAMANDSIVQGLVNIKKLWNDVAEGKPKALQQFVGQEASGLIPWSALLRAGAQGTDPLARDPQTVGQELQTNIPGQSEQVQPRFDMFAQPVPNPAMGLPARLLYPVNVTTPSKDPVVNEVARLGIHPAYPPQFLDNYPKQKMDWIRTRADGLHRELDSYIDSPEYKTNGDQMNRTRLNYIIGKFTTNANMSMLDDKQIGPMIEAHKEAMKGLPNDLFAPQENNEFSAFGASSQVPAVQ